MAKTFNFYFIEILCLFEEDDGFLNLNLGYGSPFHYYWVFQTTLTTVSKNLLWYLFSMKSSRSVFRLRFNSYFLAKMPPRFDSWWFTQLSCSVQVVCQLITWSEPSLFFACSSSCSIFARSCRQQIAKICVFSGLLSILVSFRILATWGINDGILGD